MAEVRQLLRSRSQALCGLLTSVLHLPVTLDRQLSLEAGQVSAERRLSRREAEEEWEAGFTGERAELAEYTNLQQLQAGLACSGGCGEMLTPPAHQCRPFLSCQLTEGFYLVGQIGSLRNIFFCNV